MKLNEGFTPDQLISSLPGNVGFCILGVKKNGTVEICASIFNPDDMSPEVLKSDMRKVVPLLVDNLVKAGELNVGESELIGKIVIEHPEKKG